MCLARDGGISRRAFLAGLLAAGACGGRNPVATRTPPVPATTAPTAPASTAPPVTTTTTTTTDPAAEVAAGRCPVPPAPGPDPHRPRYVVSAVADPVSGEVTGTARIRFVPDVPTDRIVLRVWANAPRLTAAGVSAEVPALRLDGRPVTPVRPDPTTVVIPRPVAAGEVVDGLEVDFRIRVGGAPNDRVARADGALRLGSFVPLVPWWPGRGWVTDPPTTAFAEAVTSPVADWEVTVAVPDGHDVLASAAPDADGARRITARDFALTVGRFAAHSVEVAAAAGPGGAPVTVTVGAHDGIVDPRPFADKVAACLERFAGDYGPYPWPTYTLAVTGALTGGIEFPAHVQQGPGTLGRTTSHEVAHQWFYGLVGSNQAVEPWIDEGLATWAESRFEGTTGDMVAREIPAVGRGRAGEPMTFWDDHPRAYYRSVYVQTAAALARSGPPEAVDCALARLAAVGAHRLVDGSTVVAVIDGTVPGAAGVLAAHGIRPG